MAEEEKEEEPKKGGLMRIIMLALGAIALIGIGVGAGYFLFGGKPACLLYTSPSPRDRTRSRMPSSA